MWIVRVAPGLSDDVGQAELVDEHTILNCEQASATAECSIEVSVGKLRSIDAKSQAESERLQAGIVERISFTCSRFSGADRQKGEGANRALKTPIINFILYHVLLHRLVETIK